MENIGTKKSTKNSRLTELEIEKSITMNASWHKDYKDSAYVIVSGLHYQMNEGDIAIVFSQFGEIADILLMRDRKTKKSRGFAFIAYVDQRSTDLAVDNFNEVDIWGRTVKIEHLRDFKLGKEYMELKPGEEIEDKLIKPTGPDGRGWGVFRTLTEEEQKGIEEHQKKIKAAKQEALKRREKHEEITSKFKIKDHDELWEEKLMKQMELYGNKELDEVKAKLAAIKEERKQAKKLLKKEKKKSKKNKEGAKKKSHKSKSHKDKKIKDKIDREEKIKEHKKSKYM